ncbi:OmpA family protein [Colwellia sp. KU-HH00111]|uniref:OmpA family protein n=1 Tax=Colwellia sp. KU-HH00111 TaxID=3127652 RepID=UPI00336555CF
MLEKPKTQLASIIYFDYDKADISNKAAKTLTSHADYLVKHPTKKVRLEGHADERGNVKYNATLGKNRAVAAAKHLHQQGVKAEQMLVTSLGENKPVDKGTSEKSYASNRRVELKPIDK